MVTMQIILNNNNTNNIFMVAMAFLHLSPSSHKYAKRVTVIWSRASCDIINVWRSWWRSSQLLMT